MITILPAVQHGCKRARHYISYSASSKRHDKRTANRRHRRMLNRVTRGFVLDLERFYSEDFRAPSLSPYDIW
jgi:hypothetical protein